MLKVYLNYLLYILLHKKNVFKACWERGLYKQAFTHDLSKFGPKEFAPYARYFYKDKELYKEGFEKACTHHYENNPHHWNYWIRKDGPIDMPTAYVKEMIADWEAMGMKFKNTAQEYYLNNYNRIKLSNATRLELEWLLGINDSLTCNYGHTLEQFTNKYDEETYNHYFGRYIKDKYGIDSYSLLKK